jgi:hypothetical protein
MPRMERNATTENWKWANRGFFAFEYGFSEGPQRAVLLEAPQVAGWQAVVLLQEVKVGLNLSGRVGQRKFLQEAASSTSSRASRAL